MPNQIPDEIREQIIDLYREGARTADITAVTGIARSSIYSVLHQEGVKPTRKSGPRRPRLASSTVMDPTSPIANPYSGDGDHGDAQMREARERFTLIRAQQEQILTMLARVITMLERIEQH